MKALLYTLPVLGSLAATITLLMTMARAQSAPQEAAGFAMACALAIIPYVFARSIDLTSDKLESLARRQADAAEKAARALEQLQVLQERSGRETSQ
jgi:hypothetical protein